MSTKTALTADFVSQIVRILQARRQDITFHEATQEELEGEVVFVIKCLHKEQELHYRLTLRDDSLQTELQTVGENKYTFQQDVAFGPPYEASYIAGILRNLFRDYEDGLMKKLVDAWFAAADGQFAKSFGGDRKTAISVSTGRLSFSAQLKTTDYSVDFTLEALPNVYFWATLSITNEGEEIGRYEIRDSASAFTINQFCPAVIDPLFNFLYRAAVVGLPDEHKEILGKL